MNILIIGDKKSDYFEQLASIASKQDLMMRTLLYFALGVLLIAFGFVSKFELMEWVVCICACVFAFYMAIVNMIAVSRKK